MNKTPNDLADFYLKHYKPFCNKNKIDQEEFSPRLVAGVFNVSDTNKSAIELLDFFLYAKRRIGEIE